jgi:hypothetical protein
MTQEQYNKYLNLYNSSYKDEAKKTEIFKYGLDLSNILILWHNIGFKTNSYYMFDGYKIDFLNKESDIVGHAKAYTGEGMGWEWPDLILEIYNFEKELEAKTLHKNINKSISNQNI